MRGGPSVPEILRPQEPPPSVVPDMGLRDGAQDRPILKHMGRLKPRTHHDDLLEHERCLAGGLAQLPAEPAVLVLQAAVLLHQVVHVLRRLGPEGGDSVRIPGATTVVCSIPMVPLQPI